MSYIFKPINEDVCPGLLFPTEDGAGPHKVVQLHGEGRKHSTGSRGESSRKPLSSSGSLSDEMIKNL